MFWRQIFCLLACSIYYEQVVKPSAFCSTIGAGACGNPLWRALGKVAFQEREGVKGQQSGLPDREGRHAP